MLAVEPSANWDSVRSPTSGNHNLSAPFPPSRHHRPAYFLHSTSLLAFLLSHLRIRLPCTHRNERAVPSFPSLLTFSPFLRLLLFPCLPSVDRHPLLAALLPRQRDTLAVSIARLPSAASRHRPAGSHEHASNHTQQRLRLQANTLLSYQRPTASRRVCYSPRIRTDRTPASFAVTRCIHLQDNKRLAALRESSPGRNARRKEQAGWLYWRSRKTLSARWRRLFEQRLDHPPRRRPRRNLADPTELIHLPRCPTIARG